MLPLRKSQCHWHAAADNTEQSAGSGDRGSEPSASNETEGSKAKALPYETKIKPYHYMVAAGVTRIMSVMALPNKARFKAPFSAVLGHNNAVALSMVVFGACVMLLSRLLIEKRVHESAVGQWCISIGSLVAALVLYNFG